MKKSILILLVMILAHTGLKAQYETQVANASNFNNQKVVRPDHISYTGTGNEKNYEFYMKRSKNYRTVGWATLIGGVVISGIGLLIANADYSTSESDKAAWVTLIGATSGVVSIPFMIMASAYKLKAKLILEKQKTGFTVPPNISKDIIGITMIMPIGK